MADMRIFDSKPALRWLAPVAVLALVGGTGLVAATANAGDKLPDRSAEQLLVDLQDVNLTGMSGTVVQQANLGIPAIPGTGDAGDLTSMLSGTHSLMVWYADPGKARVALKSGSYSESDVITNGTDVWTWSSRDQEATHRTLSARERRGSGTPEAPAGAPKTPQEAAQWVLGALGSSTEVTTASDVEVAGEQAYELVLRPKTDDSLLTEVTIAIDGDTHVPLRVQAYAGDTLVFEVEYQSVSFATPDDGVFEFNPPADTTVKEAAPSDRPAPSQAERDQAKQQSEAQQDKTTTFGTGWSTVVVTEAGDTSSTSNDQLQGFLSQLPSVSGSWGQGRLLKGTAFSAVLTDDGRVAVGAVKPELLYQALGK